MQVGETYVPAKPWEHGRLSATVRDAKQLSGRVQELLAAMAEQAAAESAA